MDKLKFIEDCLMKISVSEDETGIIYSISLDYSGNPVETGSDDAEICFISCSCDDAIHDAWMFHINTGLNN